MTHIIAFREKETLPGLLGKAPSFKIWLVANRH